MKIIKNIVMMLMAVVLLASCGEQNTKKVSIAYANWAEGIAMSNLAKVVLEEQGYKVALKNADIAPIFASLAAKDVDLFLDSWLPITHEDYFAKYGDKLHVLGTLFDDAKVGLVVPTYIDINSIEELNVNKDKFNKEIVGIDTGAGIMRSTDEAIKEYGLDMKLLSSTGPMMVAALDKAIKANEWVVVTGWKPHYKFGKYDLKFLEDSKNVYGDAELIKSVCWKGFEEQDPFVVEFIGNMHFDTEQIGALMAEVESATSEIKGAQKWLDKNRDLVNKWIPKTVDK